MGKGIVRKTGLLMLVPHLLWLLKSGNPKSYCSIQVVQFLYIEHYFGVVLLQSFRAIQRLDLNVFVGL